MQKLKVVKMYVTCSKNILKRDFYAVSGSAKSIYQILLSKCSCSNTRFVLCRCQYSYRIKNVLKMHPNFLSVDFWYNEDGYRLKIGVAEDTLFCYHYLESNAFPLFFYGWNKFVCILEIILVTNNFDIVFCGSWILSFSSPKLHSCEIKIMIWKLN